MKKDNYLISVIIPTFNEEKNIIPCLKSIVNQTHPLNKIEIIIVDDYSSDKTVEIAKKYKAEIYYSGKKHIEFSKSIGIAHAKGDLLFFMDADIRLSDKKCIEKFEAAFRENDNLVGAQAVYWKYSKGHNFVNRYCELLGVNDPFVYNLGKRGILGPFELKWPNPKVIKQDNQNYFLAEFNIYNLPTLGSQGFMVRKSILIEYVTWKPYFFHLDAVYELVKANFNTFALMKISVEHDYVNSLNQYYKKLHRNILLFLKYRKYRKFAYQKDNLQFLFTTLLMITVLFPLFQSMRGYLKKQDIAWFLHPVLCLTIPYLYASVVLNDSLNKILHKIIRSNI